MWSDGDLTEGEVQRGRIAAKALHISARHGGAFGAIADGAIPFGEIGFDRIQGPARRLAYAAAQWVAAANIEPSTLREAFFRALKVRLSISDEDAEGLRDLALTLDASDAEPSEALARILAVIR